jgi:hypothetical protein
MARLLEYPLLGAKDKTRYTRNLLQMPDVGLVLPEAEEVWPERP